MSRLLRILLIAWFVTFLAFTTTATLALLSDIEQVGFTGRAASLTLEVSNTDFGSASSWNLGDNLAPGDSGEETLRLTNGGTIPGIVCYEVISAPPSFLRMTLEGALCGTTLQPGETRDFKIYWNIPVEEDLGTGGQEISFALRIELTQN